MKKILPVLGLLLVFGFGFLVARYWYAAKEEKHRKEESEVLLEKIRSVAKLVTVEGYFSEIYDYEDYWGYDIAPLRKKALLRVKAKVSVGYDLGAMKFELKPEEQQLRISGIPEPHIISIDHDVDYYDITEGTFNSFTEKDYTRLNQNAKALIETKARQSDLFLTAEKQGEDMLEVIRFMAENAGWAVRFERETDSFRN
jgi:hypothetical protein